MPKKQRKIIACISTDERERRSMIRQVLVDLGFALTPSDADKLIRQSPHDYDLVNTYFIAALTANLRESALTTHRLYEMAAQGIAVVVGLKRLHKEHEFICEAYYPTDFMRL